MKETSFENLFHISAEIEGLSNQTSMMMCLFDSDNLGEQPTNGTLHEALYAHSCHLDRIKENLIDIYGQLWKEKTASNKPSVVKNIQQIQQGKEAADLGNDDAVYDASANLGLAVTVFETLVSQLDLDLKEAGDKARNNFTRYHEDATNLATVIRQYLTSAEDALKELAD